MAITPHAPLYVLRFAVAFALLLTAALAQSIMGEHLLALPGRPDFPLVCVIAWAMLRGANEGAAVGFLGGLLLDSASYTPFGLNSALLGLAGYAIGAPEANVARGNVPFFLGMATLVTLGYHTITFLLLQALGNPMPPVSEVYAMAVPAAVLNALLLGPTYFVCRRLLRAVGGWTQLRL